MPYVKDGGSRWESQGEEAHDRCACRKDSGVSVDEDGFGFVFGNGFESTDS